MITMAARLLFIFLLTAFVKVEVVDASVVRLQFVGQLESLDQAQGTHAVVDEVMFPFPGTGSRSVFPRDQVFQRLVWTSRVGLGQDRRSG